MALPIFAMVGVAACGSEDASTSATATTETAAEDTATDEAESVETMEAPEPAEAASPPLCLERAALSGIEQRDANLWRAINESPFFGVFVERFASPAEAQSVVREATAVWAAQAGSTR